MGILGSNTTEVILEDVKVPISQRIGAEGGAWWLMMRTLNRSRPAIAAQAVGLAQGSLNYAIKFVQEKGWAKKDQDALGIRVKLADMAIEIEAARALVYKSAGMMDQKMKGIPVQMFSAMAKYYASEIGVQVSTDAVQIFGGYGYTKDFPVEKFFRDSKLCTIGEGTSEIQKIVIAREILKDL